jgi:hypothetical protein
MAYQQGRKQGLPQRTDDGTEFELNLDEMRAAEPGEPEIESGVANDSGTIPGRKVNHADPHDIPPRGMKRRY